jgi:serine/threonine protein kinase/Tfp pilus assembly protein PilF
MLPLTEEKWRMLSPLLDELFELPEEDCQQRLRELRAQDPVLADLLTRLLTTHRELAEASFLETLSHSEIVATGLAGQTLGAYTLLTEIGHGGMGSVWLAERSDQRFERKVAVKFLNFALMGRSGEERFQREGRVLGRLVHPNIAELLDAGVSPTGQPYLVLEYVEGDHIDRYCDKGKVDVESRLRLFLEVLDAVAHAHANLVVHRDLKPSNILVRKDGAVKLLDFGIAKLLGQEGSGGELQITAEGERALTPEYAAPEQLKDEPVTTATDVYALGVLLYVLLTGQHPAGSAVRTAADLIVAVVETEPTHPSDVVTQISSTSDTVGNAARRATTPDRLSRVLRGDLDTIVTKALRKDARERYASVSAMAEDLRRYLRNEPISAQPYSFLYRAKKFVRRNRVVVGLASLAALATVVGGAGIWIQGRTARAQRDFALQQLARAERINDLNELLLTDLAPAGKPVTPDELLARELEIVEHEHADNANHLETLISIGDQYAKRDQNSRAREILQLAYDKSKNSALRSTHARAGCALSWTVAMSGDLPGAQALVREALRDLPAEPQYAPLRSYCLLFGAETAFLAGDAKTELADAQAAEVLLKTSTVSSPVDQLRMLTDLATAYWGAGQPEESDAAYTRAATLLDELGYGNTHYAVILYNNQGLTLSESGRALEAEQAYRRAVEISEASEGQGTDLPTLLHNYANVLRELGRFEESSQYADRALALAHQTGNTILESQVRLNRARIYRDEGDFARATPLFDEVQRTIDKQLPPGHFAFAVIASDRSLLARGRGDLVPALDLANQALNIAKAAVKSGGQGAGYLPAYYHRRSVIELKLGKNEDALMDAQESLRLLRATRQSESRSCSFGRAYLSLGQAQLALGRTQEARASFQSAFQNLQATLGVDHPLTASARSALARATQPS